MLGASVAAIVQLLSKDFLKLVIISMFVMAPVTLFVLNNWLRDFAYRIRFPWEVLVLSGGISVLIAILTISFRTIQAAVANPVRSIKSE